ncbi:MAG: tripartite tricarboxylate transporter substrate binding protein [Burkholderiales bacterium]
MKRRTLFLALASLVAGALPFGASAQQWPDKPIRFVMSAPAGSSIDVIGRTIGDKLKDRLGQPVIVDNKPAAGGTVAVAEVARAAPDGYTMVLGFNGPLATAPMLQKVPYDVQKDLAPVITTTSQPNVLAVNAQLPVKDLKELVAYAKAHPGKLNYASVGPGSSSHLNGELLKSLAGIDIVHIPFNGSPPAVTSTVQGETQMIFAVMQPLQPQIQAGKLRAIGVTSAKRFPLYPDLPTFAEAGFPKYETLAWNGIMVPAGTPKAVIDRLNSEINAIFKMPDVQQKLSAAGFELVGGTPEQFGALIRAEQEKWAPIIRSANIKID